MKAIINSISTSRRMWSQDYTNAISNSSAIKALPTNVAYSLAHRKVAAPASATAEDVEEPSVQQSQHFRVLAQKRNSLPIATDLDQPSEPHTKSNASQEVPTPATTFTYNLLPPPQTAPSINTSSSTRFVYHNGNPAEPLVLRRSPSAPRAAVDKCMTSILSEDISQARHMAALNLGTRVRPRKVHSVHADLNLMANNDSKSTHAKKGEVKRRRSFVYLDTKDEANNSFGNIFDENAASSTVSSSHSGHKKTPSRIAEIYGRKRKSSAPTLSTGLHTGSTETMANLSDFSTSSLNVTSDDKLKHRRRLGHSFSSRFSSFGDSIKHFTPGNVNSSPLSTPTAIYATEGAPFPAVVEADTGARRNSRSFGGLKNTLTLKSSTSEQNLAKHKYPNGSKLTETEALYIKYLQGDIGPPDESPDEEKERPAFRRSVTYSHAELDDSFKKEREERLASTSQGRGRGRDRSPQPRAVSASSNGHGSNHKRSRSRFTMLMSPRLRHQEQGQDNDNEEVLQLRTSDLPTPQLELPEVGRMSPLSKFFIFGQSDEGSSDGHDMKRVMSNHSRKSRHSRLSSEVSQNSAHQFPLHPPQPPYRSQKNQDVAPVLSRSSTEASHAGVPQLPKLVIGEDGGAEWRQRERQKEHQQKEEERGMHDFGPRNGLAPETGGSSRDAAKSSKHKSWHSPSLSKSSPNLLSRLNSLSSTKSKKSSKGKDTAPSTPLSADSGHGDECRSHHHPSGNTLNRKKSLKAFLTKMNFTRV